VSVINRGAFGLVVLCKETATDEAVAVKLIERGLKVRMWGRHRDFLFPCRRLSSVRLAHHHQIFP
jgi:hypothetical protein